VAGQGARVVFVTGDTLTTASREFVAECGRPVIEKPFSPDEVRRVVAELAHEVQRAPRIAETKETNGRRQ
jgi:two-component system NtrC family sensor kinase